MKSQFALLCIVIVAFLGFGYYYKQQYYPAGAETLAPELALAKARACAEAFEKIEVRPNCESKLEDFQKHWSDCNDQKVNYRETVFSYNDYYFQIVDCFVEEKKEARAIEVLHQIEKLPKWQRLGPTDCSITDETKARLESLSFADNVCLKETDLQSWVGTSPDLSADLLKQMALRNHTLSCGSYNSDDICFCPLELISKVTSQHKNLLVTEVEATEHGTKHIKMVNSKTGKNELILEMKDQSGCLFISSVYSASESSAGK